MEESKREKGEKIHTLLKFHVFVRDLVGGPAATPLIFLSSKSAFLEYFVLAPLGWVLLINGVCLVRGFLLLLPRLVALDVQLSVELELEPVIAGSRSKQVGGGAWGRYGRVR
jgi:hypothetical protein